MAEEYKSRWSGEQIDEAIDKIYGDGSTPDNLLYKSDILSITGTALDKVMSQAATSNILNQIGLKLEVYTTLTTITLGISKYIKITEQSGNLTLNLESRDGFAPEYRAKITTVADSDITFPAGTLIITNKTDSCIITNNIAKFKENKTFEINIQDGICFVYVF